MGYRVLAGYVSAETEVHSGGRAVIDHPRGSVLPDDVPQEQIDRFLRHGHIEPVDEDVVEPEPEGDEGAGEGDPVDLSEMDKDALLAYADEHDIAVDKRLGVDNLRAAIEAAE